VTLIWWNWISIDRKKSQISLKILSFVFQSQRFKRQEGEYVMTEFSGEPSL